MYGLSSCGIERSLTSTRSSDLMGILLYSTDPVFPGHEQLSSTQETSAVRPLYDRLQHSFKIDQAVLDLTTTLMKQTRILMSLRRHTVEIELDSAVVQARFQIQEALNNVDMPQTLAATRSHAPVSVALETVCLIAASICSRLIESSTPESEHAPLQEVGQLRLALEGTDTLDWDGGWEVLLWILLVAITADKHRPDRRWFIARLVTLLISLGVSHFPSIENLIRDFI